MGWGGIYQLAKEKLLFVASDSSSHMRDTGRDGKQRKRETESNVEERGGESKGGGSHIAHLQAVNNLEEHWGDETKMNKKHWQRLT